MMNPTCLLKKALPGIKNPGRIKNAGSNIMNQGRYETEFLESEGRTCIDVKDFIYDWVKPEIVNNGLIIVHNSKRISLLPVEVRAEPIGELKLKYIPVAK